MHHQPAALPTLALVDLLKKSYDPKVKALLQHELDDRAVEARKMTAAMPSRPLGVSPASLSPGDSRPFLDSCPPYRPKTLSHHV